MLPCVSHFAGSKGKRLLKQPRHFGLERQNHFGGRQRLLAEHRVAKGGRDAVTRMAGAQHKRHATLAQHLGQRVDGMALQRHVQ